MPSSAEQRSFAVVTTCHAAGYRDYGQVMVETYLRHWPQQVPLLLYHESFDPPVSPGRVFARDLVESSPELMAFKARHRDDPRAHGDLLPRRRLRLGPLSIPLPMRIRKAKYRWDAVRFAHKAYAIFDAARRTDADLLIWIDADTRFFADVDFAELAALSPPESAVSCLRRPQHSECGFVVYNLRHPETRRLLQEFEAMYSRDLFWREREYHDSYLFDVVRRRAEARGAQVHDIGEGAGWKASHVLINSRLGRFMDHMKGDRKSEGKSRAGDLLVQRDEEYWKQQQQQS
ncbi:hypothetical protein [Xylophilus sp. GOD-11R]|uniref:hypothetical protein n=1 Tax=Xylophilus sp. GOD-11R TaxID=3089814 RepID=UPI00298D56DF|nr:hypothetical protein [Xylophilus sp. GOD-11R]WPB58967.1 hypothetical protein R9X41_10155 [Xylophilus sp. GOD-11R]